MIYRKEMAAKKALEQKKAAAEKDEWTLVVDKRDEYLKHRRAARRGAPVVRRGGRGGSIRGGRGRGTRI